MHASPSSALRVRVIDSEPEFASLAGAWEELQKDAAVTSVFASFGWQHTWWKSYGQGQPLRLLVALQGETVLGILPLYVAVAPTLRYPVRLLKLVGSGGDTSPDDLGPVLARQRESEVAAALADAVLRLPDWDVLLLSDLDPRCTFTSTMLLAAQTAGLDCHTGRSERIAYVELPDTWEGWLSSLHRDRRYRIRNARKKLTSAHPTARFFVWDDAATLDAGIDRLIYLHHKRWQSLGEKNYSFSTPEYVEFHRAVMKACFARDRLRLYCLELSGEIVAMYYFYKFRDAVYLMQSGFDPAFSALKPGQVLLGYIIEHAIGEQHGVLDFLRGEHRYKNELATGERQTVYLTAFRRAHPGSWVYRARRILMPKVKAQLLKALRRVHPDPSKAE